MFKNTEKLHLSISVLVLPLDMTTPCDSYTWNYRVVADIWGGGGVRGADLQCFKNVYYSISIYLIQIFVHNVYYLLCQLAVKRFESTFFNSINFRKYNETGERSSYEVTCLFI